MEKKADRPVVQKKGQRRRDSPVKVNPGHRGRWASPWDERWPPASRGGKGVTQGAPLRVKKKREDIRAKSCLEGEFGE